MQLQDSYDIVVIGSGLRLRILLAVCVVTLFAVSIQADETPCEPATVVDPFHQMVGTKLEKILNPTGNEELDFRKVPVERVLEAIRFMEDSEKLVAEAETEMRGSYYEAILELYFVAAQNNPDATQSDTYYLKALEAAARLSDGEEFKKIISFVQAHGFEAAKIEFGIEFGDSVHDGAQTIEEALTIKDRQRRDQTLSSLSYRFLEQEPPNFEEALRANGKISDDNAGQRWLNNRSIAVKQFQFKQVDEAEKTLQLIEKTSDYWIETQLLFVLICDTTGNTALARRYIDAIFAELRNAESSRADINRIVNASYRFRECLIQLKTVEIARHIAQGMVDIYEQLEKEYQQRGANSPFFGLADESRKMTGSETLANVLLHIGEREEGLKHLNNYREEITASAKRYRTMQLSDRAKLIAIQYKYGLQEDAKKEIADIIAMIEAGGQTSTNGNEPKSVILSSFFRDLVHKEGLLAEAVRIAQLIPDEKLRFEAYDQIVSRVDFHFGPDDDYALRPRPRFASRQAVLDIAELLTDELGGKSLESYRARIRQYAEKMP